MAMRLGIDVGGTFTDLALIDDESGTVTIEKVLTTPSDPWLGICAGVRQLWEKGAHPSQISLVIHGTTLVINALIERRGAPIGLLTTAGFRDVLAFGREFRYDVYDPDLALPAPLVPRRLRREIYERVGGDGEIVEPLDRERARSTIRELLAENVKSFAVCLLHSYRRSDHEQALDELLQAEAPDHPVSLSHEVLPQIREFERTSTTVINAYVQPIIRRYVRQLRDGLAAEGLPNDPYLMTSSGTTMTVQTAESFPVQLVESGPAGGVLISSLIGEQIGMPNLLSFDMGGTTAKACVIRDGAPLVTRNYEVAHVRRFRKGSGLPLGVPVIDLLETGAGGGSIAEIDALGLLTVGPRSAGADPGPACYALGGTEPTVTDANVVLGLLNPALFLGGAMSLDPALAERAIAKRVGSLLGLTAEHAAAAIHQVVTENMAEAIRVHAVEVNVDVRSLGMVAYGGAGPLHAVGIAQRLQAPLVIFPPSAGVLSALGLLTAPLGFESTLSSPADLEDLDVDATNALLSELERQGRRLLADAGIADVRVRRSVDMCYVDQRYEVTTPIASTPLTSMGRSELKSFFDQAYEEAYGRRLDGLPARCITWRVLCIGPIPPLLWRENTSQSGHVTTEASTGSAVHRWRPVFFPDQGQAVASVYSRTALPPRASLDGPALIEDTASTIVIPPGTAGHIDDWGNIIVRLRS